MIMYENDRRDRTSDGGEAHCLEIWAHVSQAFRGASIAWSIISKDEAYWTLNAEMASSSDDVSYQSIMKHHSRRRLKHANMLRNVKMLPAPWISDDAPE